MEKIKEKGTICEEGKIKRGFEKIFFGYSDGFSQKRNAKSIFKRLE